VLARASRGCLVPFLAKDHVLRREPSDFDQKLAGSRALHSPIKHAALGLARRRPDILFSTVLAPSLLVGHIEIVVWHLSLHSESCSG
jgi:hypothetical protein